MCERFFRNSTETLYKIFQSDQQFLEDFVEINLENWIRIFQTKDFFEEYYCTGKQKTDRKKDESVNLLLRIPLTFKNLIYLMDKFMKLHEQNKYSEDVCNIFLDHVGKSLSDLVEKLDKLEEVIKSEVEYFDKNKLNEKDTRLKLINQANELGSYEAKNFLINHFKYVKKLYGDEFMKELNLEDVFLKESQFSYKSIFYLNA